MPEDNAQKAIDKIVKSSHGSGRESVDGIFSGFMELFAITAKLEREARERKKEERRKKARERYALRKKLGIPNRKPKAKLEPEYEYEAPTSCYCSTCRMPPCGWCESGMGGDDDE